MASFTAKASSSEGTYELPPAGAHPAVLVGLIDLGTHTRTFNGDSKTARKIMFIWELTAESNSKGENFVVAQDYTWSLNKKAKLRPLIEGYAGRALRDDEAFDFGTLLGVPCQVTLTANMTSGGKSFVEVSGACKPMRGLTVPPATREVFTFSPDDLEAQVPDLDIPAWIPRLYGREVSDEIKASEEYQALPDSIPF